MLEKTPSWQAIFDRKDQKYRYPYIGVSLDKGMADDKVKDKILREIVLTRATDNKIDQLLQGNRLRRIINIENWIRAMLTNPSLLKENF